MALPRSPLYLVTQREALPPGVSLEQCVQEALQGGVEIVQLREKHADSREFLEIARGLQTICDAAEVPLVINDRVDIALACGCRAVHLGQSDLSVKDVCALMPTAKSIGVSAHDVSEATVACATDDVSLIGIGPIYATTSKSDAKEALGPRKLARIIDALRAYERTLSSANGRVSIVAIGGINASNAARVLHMTCNFDTGETEAGLAVISAIVSSPRPREAAQSLSDILADYRSEGRSHKPSREDLLANVVRLHDSSRESGGLLHHITNTVVQNQCANVALALRASPIMSMSPEEAGDLSAILGCLVINLGTLTDDSLRVMKEAGRHANSNKKPIVFDPVGVGASAFRQSKTDQLLDHVQMSIIKGNAGELAALSGDKSVRARGVDSAGGFADPVKAVRDLARQERCVVVLTGQIDYISDGMTVIKLSNGVPHLGNITGSGCATGTCIAAYASAAHSMSTTMRATVPQASIWGGGDMLSAAVGGILAMTVAAEIAMEKQPGGPSTFTGHLIDALYNLTAQNLVERARVEVV
ncbi:uncharacterized protein L969DRAFT_45949 [Mixia osmundae IAM 14324]|uniref:Thiamine phosphate synthase/TenI domain-containing protein n=1 Tax=Mixia osmundae (strain CBS 9802 / IAM 14324 / JCM 22182 / KY 12970) TaxID=764103 RepID=G7DU99_MIXOS|nr:uncharacterized protein L969DRAFT_45949 [Mixia osmundae IAM 14324]KEI41030.1 hypothetical protein L969DRAFT_45949 [Mixia osmundae IAM 14324]GAA94159.1 hypothetical protein E5Q_00807 [Mixia osmundae IAM 14324]